MNTQIFISEKQPQREEKTFLIKPLITWVGKKMYLWKACIR